MRDGQRLQPQVGLRQGLARWHIDMPLDDCREQPVKRQQAILGDCHAPAQAAALQFDNPSGHWKRLQRRSHIVGAQNPFVQTCRPGKPVQPKPAGMIRRWHAGIGCDGLQIKLGDDPQHPVMRGEMRMMPARRHRQARSVLNMQRRLVQRFAQHGDMIEFQHA